MLANADKPYSLEAGLAQIGSEPSETITEATIPKSKTAMNDIAGISYIEAQFNKGGTLENQNQINLPPDVMDLVVISRGWDNHADASPGRFTGNFLENGAKRSCAGCDLLLAMGGSYSWQSGRFHNLESSKYIVDPSGRDAHGFVTGKEVACHQLRDGVAVKFDDMQTGYVTAPICA